MFCNHEKRFNSVLDLIAAAFLLLVYLLFVRSQEPYGSSKAFLEQGLGSDTR